MIQNCNICFISFIASVLLYHAGSRPRASSYNLHISILSSWIQKKKGLLPLLLLFTFSQIYHELAFVCDSRVIAFFHHLVFFIVAAIKSHFEICAKKVIIHSRHSFRHFPRDEQCLICCLEVAVATMLNARSGVDGKLKPHDWFLSSCLSMILLYAIESNYASTF